MPLTPLTVGSIFANRYNICHKGKASDSSVVYSAYDKWDEKKVVLKTIPVDVKRAEYTYVNERRVLNGNIIRRAPKVYDFGRVDDNYFFSMEFINGISLIEVIGGLNRIGMTLPLYKVIQIVVSFASFLHSFHRNGLVYLDQCPHNAILEGGNVRPIDFGMVIPFGENLLYSPRVAYIGPEFTTEGEQYADPRTDLFSLSTIFWELLHSGPLFYHSDIVETINAVSDCRVSVSRSKFFDRFEHDSPSFGFVSSLPKDIYEIAEECFDGIKALLMKGFEKKKEDRIQRSVDYYNALLKIFPLAARLAKYERRIGVSMIPQIEREENLIPDILTGRALEKTKDDNVVIF